MCSLQSCDMSCHAVASMLFTVAVMPQVFHETHPAHRKSICKLRASQAHGAFETVLKSRKMKLESQHSL